MISISIAPETGELAQQALRDWIANEDFLLDDLLRSIVGELRRPDCEVVVVSKLPPHGTIYATMPVAGRIALGVK